MSNTWKPCKKSVLLFFPTISLGLAYSPHPTDNVKIPCSILFNSNSIHPSTYIVKKKEIRSEWMMPSKGIRRMRYNNRYIVKAITLQYNHITDVTKASHNWPFRSSKKRSIAFISSYASINDGLAGWYCIYCKEISYNRSKV